MMQNGLWVWLAIFLLILSEPLRAEDVAVTPKRLTAAERLAPAALAKSITLAAEYLERHCDKNGRFVYRTNLRDKVNYGTKYNLVRHAGAMYALGMYHHRTPNEKTKQVLIRAGKFLNTFIEPIDKEKKYLAVITYPDRLGNSKTNALVSAKLGGAALGLIGLVQQAQAAPGSVPLARLRGVGEFLLYSQKKSGEFYSKFYPGKGGLSDAFTSLYYPGEAVLALLYLSDVDDDPRWLQGAVKGMTYLASIRRNPQSIPPDHWALIATVKLLAKMKGKGFPASDCKAIRRHADMVARLILSEQTFTPNDAVINGAFATNQKIRDARTCPTATRLEGLLAIRSTIPPTEIKRHQKIRRSIEAGLVFILQTQATSGPLAGGIPRGACPLKHVRNRADLKYMQRRNEVRIDYVQHALSAFMEYEALLKAEQQQGLPAAAPAVSPKR